MPQTFFVSPGLDPGVHVFIGYFGEASRGWPGRARSRRFLTTI
jgi:hypothetical protein